MSCSLPKYNENSKNRRKNKKAFTLAEVLITLTMTGILAAMIISSVLQKMQEIQLKTAWKQTFSDVSQASNKLASIYSYDLAGVLVKDDIDDNEFRDKFLSYMSYTQKCDINTPPGPNGCWHSDDKWYLLSGKPVSEVWPNATEWYTTRAVLSNGAFLAFSHSDNDCTHTDTPNHDSCGTVSIDVNGFKAPNTTGKDIFRVHITRSGRVIPAGVQGTVEDPAVDPWSYSCDAKTYTGTQGWACSTDYLKQ